MSSSHEDDLARYSQHYRMMAAEMAGARDDMARAARAAYADGMRKADILRAINHTWSREWLDRVLAEADRTSEGDHGTDLPPSAA